MAESELPPALTTFVTKPTPDVLKTLFASDIVWTTPKKTINGVDDVVAFLSSGDTPPNWDTPFEKVDDTTYKRKGSAKMMMMTIKLTQTVTLEGDKIKTVTISKA